MMAPLERPCASESQPAGEEDEERAPACSSARFGTLALLFSRKKDLSHSHRDHPRSPAAATHSSMSLESSSVDPFAGLETVSDIGNEAPSQPMEPEQASQVETDQEEPQSQPEQQPEEQQQQPQQQLSPPHMQQSSSLQDVTVEPAEEAPREAEKSAPVRVAPVVVSSPKESDPLTFLATAPAIASSASATVASVSTDHMAPIRHALLPSSSPVLPPAHTTEDGMLTPRSLARKIAEHNERSHSPVGGEGDVEDETSFDHPVFASAEDESAPRFTCVVGKYRLKGEGLDIHTRYEIATKWKRSLVEASIAAIAAAKAKNHQQDENDDAPTDATTTASSSSTSPTIMTKVPATSKVARRYNDFVALQDILTHLYPSYLIPCLPPKGRLHRFDEEFINARKRGLQRFLYDLGRMPSPVCEDKLILPFLVGTPREWESVAAAASQQYNMKSNWLIQGTMNLTSKLITSMGVRSAAEDHSHDEHYNTSVESAAYHTQLSLQYDHLDTMFDQIVVNEQELADAWLQWYAGFEESDDSLQSSRIAHTHDLLGLDMAALLPLTQRIGLISLKKADTEACSISELLHHTAGMIHQIQALFKRRHAVSHAVTAADAQVKATAAQLETMRRRAAMGEKTTEDEQRLSTSLTQCQAILRDRQSSLASFHAVAEEQIRSYTRARREEMRRVVIEFIQIQLAHEEQVQAHFGQLLKSCEAHMK